MLISDATHLQMLKAVGGVCARAAGGQFSVVFENEFIESVSTESTTPAATCRTSDVERHGIKKGVEITILNKVYRVQRHEPDGTGLSRLILTG